MLSPHRRQKLCRMHAAVTACGTLARSCSFFFKVILQRFWRRPNARSTTDRIAPSFVLNARSRPLSPPRSGNGFMSQLNKGYALTNIGLTSTPFTFLVCAVSICQCYWPYPINHLIEEPANHECYQETLQLRGGIAALILQWPVS